MTNSVDALRQASDTDEYRRLHYPDRDTMPACAGDWQLFDPPEEYELRDRYRERSALARKICKYCPILDDCTERVTTLTNRDKRGFTYAGVTYNAAGDPIAVPDTERATA